MGRPVQHQQCTIAGCKADHYAKGLCRAHYQRKRAKKQSKVERKMTTPQRRYKMVSVCCEASVTEGEQHDHGKQYCNNCIKPCYWKYGP